MALTLNDRVLETCTSPGTGAVTLLGATTGFRTFLAGVGNGNTCYYTIADQSGGSWEVGLGTYTSSSNTLARTTILSSSNSGSLVNFNSGTQNVFVTYPAEKAVYLDASGAVVVSGDFTAANFDATGGVYAAGAWTGTFTDGIVIDYTTGIGRLTVGASDGFTFYNGGPSSRSALMTLDANGNLMVGTTTATGKMTSIAGTSAGIYTQYFAGVGGGTLGQESQILFGCTFSNNWGGADYGPRNAGAISFGAYNAGTSPRDWSMKFYVATSGADTPVERMRINNAGYLGIGTSSPDAPLTFAGATGRKASFYQGTQGYSIGVESSEFRFVTDASAIFSWRNGSTYSTSTEYMRLDSSGNLGLGVTPSGWTTGGNFDLAGNKTISSSTSAINVGANFYYGSGGFTYKTTGYASYYNQSSGVHSWLTAPSGTAGNAISFTQAMTLDASGNLLVGGTSAPYSSANRGHININGSTDAVLGFTIGNTAKGFLWAQSSSVTLGTAAGSNILFDINGERARIDSSGNFLVGTTNTDPAGNNVTGVAIRSGTTCSIQNGSSVALTLGSSANNTYLQVFRNAGTLAGYISVPTANTTTYNSVSDQRLKENIVDAPSAIDSINAIKVRSFDWKSDGLHVDYGYIAQELLEVAPEAVSASDDPEDMMGVDFGRLTPRLVKAIQELTARIEQLEAR